MDIRAMISSRIAILAVLFMNFIRTDGHGRLIEPPSRSSMWRYGYQTPANYDDNQLFCGGYDVQWNHNGGRCGVCGDLFNGPRDNEAGGRYATGTIVRRYREGQTITVGVDVTVNHGGYFQFRICANNNPSIPVTESCLNRTVLRQRDGSSSWQLPPGTRVFYIQLLLPMGLTCSQCVLQWKYNTASNWGCDNGNCCKGCGPQEQFYGCADVSVSRDGSSSGGLGAGSFIFGNPAPSDYIGPTQPSDIGSANQGAGYIPIIRRAATRGSGFIPIKRRSANHASNTASANQDSDIVENNSGSANQGSEILPVSSESANRGLEFLRVNSESTFQNAEFIQSNSLPANPTTVCEATPIWKSRYAYATRWCRTHCAAGNCPPEYCSDGCRSTYRKHQFLNV